jgi:hypothetical protein
VVAQLREFFGRPRSLLWAAIPAAAGVAGGLLLRVYQGQEEPVALLGAEMVCVGLAVAIWIAYSILATAPTLLRGTPLAAMLRKDALTFAPLVPALLLAAVCASAGTEAGSGKELITGALVEVAVALMAAAVGMKAWFLGADLSARAEALRGKRAGLCLAGIVLLGAGAIALAAVWRHGQFMTFTYDLGFMDQTVWNTAHGRLLKFSIGMTGLASRPLTGRLEVPFLLIAPLYRLWADPRLLQILQAMALGLGAVPLYAFARRRLGSDFAACVFAACFVLHPALQGIGLAAVHTNAFAVPLLIAALVSLDRGTPRAFFVWSLLALCCREDVALVTVPLGLYAACRPSFRRTGVGLSLLSVVWLVTVVVLLPRLHGPAHRLYEGEREMLGLLAEGFGGMARELMRNPSLLVTQFLNDTNALYVTQLLVPLGLLSLLCPELLLVAAPGWYLNMLTGWSQMNDIHSQYQAYVLPVLAAAAVCGAGRLSRKLTAWAETSPWARANCLVPRNALPAVCLVCLLCAVYGRLALGRRVLPSAPWPAEHTLALREAVRRIPPTASVTAPQHLGPHLSQRLRLFVDPAEGMGEYVIVDAFEPLLWPDGLLPHTGIGIGVVRFHPLKLLRRSDYGVCFSQSGVVVLKRGADHRGGLLRLYAGEAEPGDAPLPVVLDGWRLFGASSRVFETKETRCLELSLKWRPEGSAGPAAGALVCEAGETRREIPYAPGDGLLSADDAPANYVLSDRLFVVFDRRLGPRQKLSLRSGDTVTPLVEEAERPQRKRGLAVPLRWQAPAPTNKAPGAMGQEG